MASFPAVVAIGQNPPVVVAVEFEVLEVVVVEVCNVFGQGVLLVAAAAALLASPSQRQCAVVLGL